MTEPTLHIVFDDVSFSYGEEDDEARLALEHVDLTVQAGEYIALVGANGSGKSTLSKMVNALIVPTKGRVLTLGLDTATDDEDLIFDIRSEAGLVLQNPDSQIVASIVSDDVAFGPENLLVPHDEIVQRVDEALDDVKMADFAHADPNFLSGGQKQRICIAGLLAMQPKVLVLDEPGAMLDIRGRRGIRRVLKELNAAGLTVVLVTHFMEEAALSERVVVLNEGSVVLQGTPRDVFAHGPWLRGMGLDVPFSVKLAFALRDRGLDVPDIASPRELKEVLLTPQTSEQKQALKQKNPALFEPTLEASAAPTEELDKLNSPEKMPLVELSKVCFFYPTSNTGDASVPALDNVSLTLGRGELMGVVGHTGSGKTTLLRIIAGLLRVSSGHVQVAGVDLASSKKRPALHAKVGMVFQYPERQLFAPTVAEDVGFGAANAGLAKDLIEVKVRTALEQVGLSYKEYAERSPFELSGGEKRRVAIAGVIATGPEILIFDEPTAGLDVQGQKEIQALIHSLRMQGKSIILTSHSLDAIAELSTKVVVMSKGRIVLQGSAREVFTRANEPELKRINLGLPKASEFAKELNEAGLAVPDTLYTIQDLADALIRALALAPGQGNAGGGSHGA